jgi:DNA-binding winged helix-turn-helix (wHTH) protein
MDALRFGPFEFDRSDRVLYRSGVEVPLPPRALGVLEYLLERPGKLVSKQALMDAIWKDATVTETSLIEAISVVRQTLGDDPQQPIYIQTVHRRGYRFVASLAAQPDSPASQSTAVEQEPAVLVPAPDRQASAGGPHMWRRVTPWIAVAAAAGLIGVMLVPEGPESEPPRPVMRAVIELPPEEAVHAVSQPDFALSGDGRRLVYSTGAPDNRRLYIRDMGRFESQLIAGSSGGFAPFFSPDGQWIGFFAEGKLKKVSLEAGGGTPMVLCEAPDPHGATWNSDETIIFTPESTGGLARVPASGGNPKPFTAPERDKVIVSHRWPQSLPGGDAVLATVWRGRTADPQIAAYSLRRKQWVVLAEQGTFGRYVPTGHLVFGRGDSLVAVPFDAQHLRTSGPAVSILGGLTVDPATGAGQFTFSATGALLYVPGEVPDASRLNLVVDWFEELRRLVPLV